MKEKQQNEMNRYKNSGKVKLRSLALFMVLLLSVGMYADDYNLWIAGTRVTSSNAANLSSLSAVQSGTVVYDPGTNTLTLTNAEIRANSGKAISAETSGLTIRVNGHCTLTVPSSNNKDVLVITQPTTIVGSGDQSSYLELNSYSRSAIYMNKAPLTITNCYVEAYTSNAYSGIAGYNGTNGEILTLNSSTLIAKGSSGHASIRKLQGLVINGSGYEITHPVGAYFSPSQHNVNYSNGNIIETDWVEIGKPHGVYVAGREVTTANASRLYRIPGVTLTSGGIAKYNPSTKTFTFKNATISNTGSGEDGIQITGDAPSGDYKIELGGTNTIAAGDDGISSLRNITIKSSNSSNPGTLKVTQSAYGIYTRKTLRIENCNVESTGTTYGILGNNDSSTWLIIYNANVKAKGTSNGSIMNFGGMSIKRGYMNKPLNATYKTGTVKVAGNTWKQEVEIKKGSPYGIFVEGIGVFSGNSSDVLGDGKVSYNSSTKTLSLNNATINDTDLGADGIYIDGTLSGRYTINLTGTNTINAYDDGIQSFNDLAIEGSGKLKVTYVDYGIFMVDNKDLRIEDGTIEILSAPKSGIRGGDRATLTVRNANVKAKGTEFGSIYGFYAIYLERCYIESPSGATYSSGDIKVGGNTYKDLVTIKKGSPYGIFVKDISVHSGNKSDILGDGKISYNSSTKTLSMNNATITNTAVGAEGIHIDGSVSGDYTIDLTGTNTITVDSKGIYPRQNLTIKGSGTLKIKDVEYGIYMGEDKSLTIKDCNLEILNASLSGIEGYNAPLNINNASVKAIGPERGSIHFFTSIALTGCYIDSPSNATYSDGDVKVSGSIYKQLVTIKKGSKYDLFIGGVAVNPDNASDVLGDGKVSYSHSDKKITLNNATINAPANSNNYLDDGILIRNESNNYTIEVIGNNNSITAADDGIGSKSELTIEGTGKLRIESPFGIFFYKAGKDLKINNCSLEVICEKTGIRAQDTSSDLIINNANVKAKGTVFGSIYNFGSIVLANCYIAAPSGADISSGTVEVGGNTYKGLVEIRKGSPSTALQIQEAAVNNAWGTVGTLHIEYNEDNLNQVADVFSIQGHKVASIHLNSGINSQAMEKGIYIVRIGRETHKVIVK